MRIVKLYMVGLELIILIYLGLYKRPKNPEAPIYTYKSIWFKLNLSKKSKFPNTSLDFVLVQYFAYDFLILP